MKKSFQELINTNETPVLVDFHATWCSPCHAMNPVIQSLAQQFTGKLKVIKIDVDKNQAVAALYQVRGVPTFILFYKGNILWQQSGVIQSNDFERVLNQFVH